MGVNSECDIFYELAEVGQVWESSACIEYTLQEIGNNRVIAMGDDGKRVIIMPTGGVLGQTQRLYRMIKDKDGNDIPRQDQPSLL